MINTCLSNACFFNYWIESNFLTFFYTPLFLYIFISFKTKNLSVMALLPNKTSNCNPSEMFSSNLVSVREFSELSIIFRGSLSTGLSIFRDFISKLSIRSLRVFLYLFEIVPISVFLSILLIACLRTFYLRIAIIQF